MVLPSSLVWDSRGIGVLLHKVARALMLVPMAVLSVHNAPSLCVGKLVAQIVKVGHITPTVNLFQIPDMIANFGLIYLIYVS